MMKKKYGKPSTKVVVLRHSKPLLIGSDGEMKKLDSFDNGGDPLAD